MVIDYLYSGMWYIYIFIYVYVSLPFLLPIFFFYFLPPRHPSVFRLFLCLWFGYFSINQFVYIPYCLSIYFLSLFALSYFSILFIHSIYSSILVIHSIYSSILFIRSVHSSNHSPIQSFLSTSTLFIFSTSLLPFLSPLPCRQWGSLTHLGTKFPFRPTFPKNKRQSEYRCCVFVSKMARPFKQIHFFFVAVVLSATEQCKSVVLC